MKQSKIQNPMVGTYAAIIFISGDVARIKDICRKFCLCGLCVSITPTDYVFTGGSEAGAMVGLINYPRFESTPEKIKETALELARILMAECHQRSCTVLCTDDTEYLENPEIAVPR